MKRLTSHFPHWPLFALGFGLLLTAAAVWLLVVQPGRAQAAQQAAQSAQTPETTAVERGKLVLEASGSGSLVAKDSRDLTFAADGTLETLNVQVGDSVKAGETLAQLADLETFEIAVQTAEINLKTAQKDLQAVLSSGDAALAQALADQSQAEADYAAALAGLRVKGAGRCASAVTQSYWQTYFSAVKEAQFWENELENPNTGYGHEFLIEHLRPIQQRRDTAYINWKYCEGYTDEEVTASEAALKLAEAKRDQARAAYQALLAEQGVDRDQVALAQAAVQDAQAQLANAKAEREGASIIAPIDGTVMTVNASENARVNAGAVILTISDLSQTIFKVEMDETDLANFYVGCSAAVIFDSISTRVYTGMVTEVSPVLSTSFGYSTIEGTITLDTAEMNPTKHLPINLTGAVDITCDAADDVLLVPVTSLVTEADGSYAVLVLNASGQVETRTIEIGRRAALQVEVLSGLAEGEQVVTLPDSITQTAQ